ncbi:MAG: hypothetical protein MUD17_02255 [Gemmatimonadaceae bacterium]|nr:hypothetical protein [Gemmatimonadaceae bacterium]
MARFASALRFVEGHVSKTEHFVDRGTALDERTARAEARAQRATLQRAGDRRVRAQPLDEHLQAIHSVQLLDQHREFITAESGDRVAASHRAAKTLRDHLQEVVPGRVTERIVDGFEVVQIDQEHSGSGMPAIAFGARQRLSQTVAEQRPVRQPGERIVKRLVTKLRLDFGLRGLTRLKDLPCR